MVENPFIQSMCVTSDTRENTDLSNPYLPFQLRTKSVISDTKENMRLSNL